MSRKERYFFSHTESGVGFVLFRLLESESKMNRFRGESWESMLEGVFFCHFWSEVGVESFEKLDSVSEVGVVLLPSSRI